MALTYREKFRAAALARKKTDDPELTLDKLLNIRKSEPKPPRRISIGGLAVRTRAQVVENAAVRICYITKWIVHVYCPKPVPAARPKMPYIAAAILRRGKVSRRDGPSEILHANLTADATTAASKPMQYRWTVCGLTARAGGLPANELNYNIVTSEIGRPHHFSRLWSEMGGAHRNGGPAYHTVRRHNRAWALWMRKSHKHRASDAAYTDVRSHVTETHCYRYGVQLDS
jgi:hypothetical protein